MVRPDRKGNTIMATIGTFTKNDNGNGLGHVLRSVL